MTSNALVERLAELKITPSIGLMSLEQVHTFVFDKENPSRIGRSIALGDSKASVDMLLGKEERCESGTDAYHYQKGIKVMYDSYDYDGAAFITLMSRYSVVIAISFYHESYTVEKEVKNFFGFKKITQSNPFQTFRGTTPKGIGLDSSVEDVIRAYGQPLRKNIDIEQSTMIYKGITFTFKNNQMVYIGVEDIG